MQLLKTKIPDLLIVDSDPRRDERGYFHSLFDAAIFEASDISFVPRQSGLSHNICAGTLRGLHYQTGSSTQAKLVRCVTGRLFDVVIDLRAASPTCQQWFGVELGAANHLALFVPAGFAHGFLTLEHNTNLLYELSHPENKDEATGVRWNDPRFKIAWPRTPHIINERDANYPDFSPLDDAPR
jgi:dTDP-4-dehydrorhamnose 3,5-epimerase